MPQYLVCNYMPDDFDPSTVTEAMIEEIHALNREMIAAGVRKFACGIAPPANAKTLRAQRDGKVLVTDGPYTETKEHMGGFWILECANMDEALAWAKKGAIACDVAGEVRELLFYPAPKKRRNSHPARDFGATAECVKHGADVRGEGHEIHLFWLLRQRQIRWHDGERAKRDVRYMLCI